MSIIVLIIILLIGYWWYGKATSTTGETRYVTQAVTKGTIISSVTDSGQVSASNQINVQPQVSGTITSVHVKPGDYVASGQTLFTLDDTNAQKTIRDAEMSLENANLSLQKLQLQDSTDNLNASLSTAYDNAYNSVSNTFLDLPTITNGLTNTFYKTNPTGQMYINTYAESAGPADKDTALSYRDSTTIAYNTAIDAYNTTFTLYKNTLRSASNADLDNLISQTYKTTSLISDAIQSFNNYIDFVNGSLQKYNYNIPSYIATQKATLNTYTGEVNSHLSALIGDQTSIKSSTDAFKNSDLDVQSSKLSIKQQENSLADAKANLVYYTVTAPFSGIISSVPVIVGNNAGTGTTLATIITSKELAIVSLNEVDAAKVALGDQATLTFNAIPNLTIAGKVAEIDSVGTVSSGVVNYNVQISFDATTNGGVKPGMSVNASIITNVKQNVLAVPNGAIKTQAGVSSVQMFDSPLATSILGGQGSPSAIPPRQQTVVTGISNDTSTEIVSGLKEGDIIVTKTIAGTTTTATTTTPSILGSATRGAGGAGVRIP